MNHHKFAELYTQVQILSVIEFNDSISDIQRKTSLSFVTTQKAINKLEENLIIKTNKKINKRGKSRECVGFSDEHRIFCKQLIMILDHLDLYLGNKINIEPNIRETINNLQKVKIERRLDNEQSTLDIYNMR